MIRLVSTDIFYFFRSRVSGQEKVPDVHPPDAVVILAEVRIHAHQKPGVLVADRLWGRISRSRVAGSGRR